MGSARLTDCPSVKSLLYAYLDREVAAADRSTVDRHLAECSACREVYAVEGQFLQFLKTSLVAPQVSHYTVPRIVTGSQLPLPFPEPETPH
ncbi:MAG: anti-sigma factor family protein [Nitrospirota bacterium]